MLTTLILWNSHSRIIISEQRGRKLGQVPDQPLRWQGLVKWENHLPLCGKYWVNHGMLPKFDFSSVRNAFTISKRTSQTYIWIRWLSYGNEGISIEQYAFRYGKWRSYLHSNLWLPSQPCDLGCSLVLALATAKALCTWRHGHLVESLLRGHVNVLTDSSVYPHPRWYWQYYHL